MVDYSKRTTAELISLRDNYLKSGVELIETAPKTPTISPSGRIAILQSPALIRAACREITNELNRRGTRG